MPSSKEAFLSLVRLGIRHAAGSFPDSVAWNEVQALADAQGLSAVVLDGVEVLRNRKFNVVLPPKVELTKWIGEVLQGYEYRYELYQRAIAEMAAFYNAHGFKMMILKGYACGLNWPKPEHRPCGDIDIWLFGKQKEADAVLAKERGNKIDNSHHHHSVFTWGDFSVENHYDFNNVHHHKSSVDIEKLFKELGRDDTHSVDVCGERAYLPSPNLHALFLLRHLVSHFASVRMSLRQVMDWAFFVQKHSQEIDWEWLIEILEEYHMKEFFYCINAISVEDLGFEAELFPLGEINHEIKERILCDTLSPEFTEKQPHNMLLRILFKYRRWKANSWKHHLCYSESMWSSFWSGVWNHLLKPSSI